MIKVKNYELGRDQILNELVMTFFVKMSTDELMMAKKSDEHCLEFGKKMIEAVSLAQSGDF